MVALPDQNQTSRWDFRNLWTQVFAWLAGLVPKRLFPRALIIIIAPIVILECVVAFVFMERHWESVTKRLSEFTAREIAALVEVYQTYQLNDNYRQLKSMAENDLGLRLSILPPGALPKRRPRPFFSLLDKTLSREIRRYVDRPFWIDTVGRSDFVEIRVKLDDAILRVIARRSQTYASNSHIFLVWMGISSLLLLTIAIIFLRNQIRPILSLATAADDFGKGRSVPAEFKPTGALEVRQASSAFMEMRDRIEKHVEQRTTMLAGVSHDLRTIITRLRLQIALLDESPETEALRSDIEEMQLMLEDYVAFTRGDAGEQSAPTDIKLLVEEIRDEAMHFGKPITIKLPSKSLKAELRRHGFKRVIANLVNNAMRYADNVTITAEQKRKWLNVIVEDDGPGIPITEREAVFRPFYRIDGSRNVNEGNSGLGLSIARDIAQNHGGDITLTTSKLGGLKATVKIPL